MQTRSFDPYLYMKAYIEHLKLSGTFDVPEFEVAPIMSRRDGTDIFTEGASFSGIVESKHSIACTTAVASAHVPSTIAKEDYVAKAAQAFSHPCKLMPGTAAVTSMPPQTIVWWALKNGSGIDANSDFIELNRLSIERRTELYNLIAMNIHNSVRFVNSLKGSSVLWGSWGNATTEECKATGRSRGVPTNKIGHTHVVHFSEALDQLHPIQARATYAEKLDYADPWTHMLMANLAGTIASVLTESVRVHVKEASGVKISVQSEAKPDINSLVKNLDGFIVDLDTAVRYEKVLEILACVAKTLETYYQHYLSINTQYRLLRDDTNAGNHVRKKLMDELMNHGMTIEKAQVFAKIVLYIPPESSQQDHDNSEENILRTWPLAMHASAWYLVERYHLTKDALYVHSFKIFPAFSSTKAAPEHMLNGIQRRPLGI